VSVPSLELSHEALAELGAALDPGHLIVDRELCAAFEHDITGRFGAAACAVARPADTAQVAAVVRVCAGHAIPLVPQGGNTGLVGGGVPRSGELIVSLCRLQQLGDVDDAAAQVIVGAGVTLEQLQRHARAAGLDVGIDHGARSAATIGGTKTAPTATATLTQYLAGPYDLGRPWGCKGDQFGADTRLGSNPPTIVLGGPPEASKRKK